METQDDSQTISDSELLELIHATKQKDTQAMLRLIDLYKDDILRIIKFIHLPKEDAVSMITLEFLELINEFKD